MHMNVLFFINSKVLVSELLEYFLNMVSYKLISIYGCFQLLLLVQTDIFVFKVSFMKIVNTILLLNDVLLTNKLISVVF